MSEEKPSVSRRGNEEAAISGETKDEAKENNSGNDTKSDDKANKSVIPDAPKHFMNNLFDGTADSNAKAAVAAMASPAPITGDAMTAAAVILQHIPRVGNIQHRQTEHFPSILDAWMRFHEGKSGLCRCHGGTLNCCYSNVMYTPLTFSTVALEARQEQQISRAVEQVRVRLGLDTLDRG